MAGSNMFSQVDDAARSLDEKRTRTVKPLRLVLWLRNDLAVRLSAHVNDASIT